MKKILLFLFLLFCISRTIYAEEIEFPWTPNLPIKPILAQTGSYTLNWEIDANTPAWKYAKLEENGKIVNTVYWENAANIRFWYFWFENMPNGDYSYAVYLCNASGATERCTKWNHQLVKVRNSYDKDGVIFIRESETKQNKTTDLTEKKEDTVQDTKLSEFEKKLKVKIFLAIKRNNLDENKINSIIKKIDALQIKLQEKSKKWILTKNEKRNIIILKSMRKIFESYNKKTTN